MAVYKNVTDDILYVGVNDHKVDLFEGQYVVPNGMCYNSYVIVDDISSTMFFALVINSVVFFAK